MIDLSQISSVSWEPLAGEDEAKWLRFKSIFYFSYRSLQKGYPRKFKFRQLILINLKHLSRFV